MKRYQNLSGNSAVTAYQITDQAILVAFQNRSLYRYDYRSAGQDAIEEMKILATAGRGLSSFISRVDPPYAAKLK